MMEETKHCSKCDRPDSADNLVCCDSCDTWTHFQCAGVSDSIADPERSWRCDRCKPVDDAASSISKTKISIVSSSSSRRSKRLDIGLKLIEEQRELRLRRLAERDAEREAEDEKYIKQKMDLLFAAEDEADERESRKSKSSRDVRDKVQKWLSKGGASEIQPLGTPSSAIQPQPDMEIPQQRKIPTSDSHCIVHGSPVNAKNPINSNVTIPKSTSTPHLASGSVVISNHVNTNECPLLVQYSASVPWVSSTIPYVPPISNSSIVFPSHVPSTTLSRGEYQPYVPPTSSSPFRMICPTSNVIPANRMSAYSSRPIVSFAPPLMSIASYSETNVVPATVQQMSSSIPSGLANNNQSQQGQPFGFVDQTSSSEPCILPHVAGSSIIPSIPQPHYTPSASQIAARQVMPRELPTFSEDPEDWPLFFSTFRNSTAACGYTDVENLSRLQRCLQGQALESVKSRLLIPECVPHVIETLRKLFGRPEVLIHSLLSKIRAVPPPKADKLPSIIHFGLAVQNAVDHMTVANLQEHLCNPMLLHELVEKLPPQIKMEWSSFKRSRVNVNLATFSEFMTNLVDLASDVSLPTILEEAYMFKKNKDKQKLYLHSEETGDSAVDEYENRSLLTEQIKKSCCYCSQQNHEIANCRAFRALELNARWKVMRQKGLCRNCLIPHRRWPCRSSKECGLNGCRIRHHELLHFPSTLGSQVNYTPQPSTSTNDVSHQNHHSSVPYSLFRYIPITIRRHDKQINTYAFLDDGSSSTLLENKIAVELGITGPADTLWLSWTGDITREEKESQRVTVTVAGQGSDKYYKLHNVRTVEKLSLPSQSLQYEDLKRTYHHLNGLPIHSYTSATPGIIIGIEHAWMLTTLKVREGRTNEPIAAKTRLGWCIFGKLSSGSSSVERIHFHCGEEHHNKVLHDLMRQYFVIEGATVTSIPETESEKRSREILENTTRRIGNRFETGLLWKHEVTSFPDSYPMAMKRMNSLEKRLSKNPLLKEKVREQIADYQAKGYAHRISEIEMISTDPNKVWYLPLGVVQNPRKPQKIRLIWDAAARSNGVSFNDMLLKGSDMLTSLPAILLRFRERNVGICGDIKEMFHQVRIREEDKQSQRFLWRDNPEQPPEIFVMDVATFGATCSPCSTQYVKNKNAEEFSNRFPKAAEAIVKAHYVDDYLDSVHTIDEAVELINQVKFVHSQAGFEIRNFSSNSTEVLRRLGEPGDPQNRSMNLENSIETERILGLVWKTSEDTFTFDIDARDDIKTILENHSVPTKRQVLRTIMSVFDPLGFVAHFVVHGKILMQNIWKSGSDWDEQIPEYSHDLWQRWSQMCLQLKQVQIPRCFFPGASREALETLQIHVFVDGSEEASACAAYLRIVESSTPRCAFVAAKTKVAPLKPLSIPRMELQAAMIGSRLLNTLCSSINLPIKQRYIWSDSSTVLSWLRSDSRRYHQFVAFRVGEILSTTSVSEWRYVPSKLNVADEATKWGHGPSFNLSNRWFHGPNFLFETEDRWPREKKSPHVTEEELRAVFSHHQVLEQPLLNVSRFSKWNRLVRTTAYFLRAIKLFRALCSSGPLRSEEIFEAENYLWCQAQAEGYSEEFYTLQYNKKYPEREAKPVHKSSPLYQCTPFLDEFGVIRMRSRIEAAPFAQFDAKYPILLPKNHRITFLLVDSYHRLYLHRNSETVFNEMRQRFRVPCMRAVIKRVGRECQHCRISKATPQSPMMAPLPEVRLTPFVRPFTHTGIDYFGPILVKQGRSLVKRWVALFTCLTVRAVHLEIAHTLSTQSCIMAIRRFIARRGSPATFYSDNGTNFVGASNELVEQMKQTHEQCAMTFTNARTSWLFNPPSAPHMGGCWERMVRSVKAAIAAIDDHPHHPNDEVLETVVSEAEGIVNSRPLTYIPLDSADQEALTPNHFLLYGSSGINQPASPLTIEVGVLRDSWKLAQCLVDKFWRRWIREYLPTLTRRTKWFQPTKPLEPGEFVVVVDENKRNGWIRGRILEVIRGTDGQVRQAIVQTKNGPIKRPAVKIALLDINRNRENLP